MQLSRYSLRLILPALVFCGVVLYILNLFRNSQRKLLSNCLTGLPFWSRGFARSCCDIYPTSFGKHKGGFFEAGILTDASYFLKRSPKSADIIYVATADFPAFLEVFSKLDKTIRITLVTGGEDIGAPWEIFHPNRNFYDYKMSALWPRGQLMTMRQFLNDERLLKWYAQNYDLVGNTSYTRSDVNVIIDKDIIAKVHPLPIGLDFHTLAEKNKNLSPQQALDSVCEQRSDLSTILSTASPFLHRKSSIYAKFDCAFKQHKHMRVIGRGDICRLLESNSMNSSKNHTDHVIFSEAFGAKTQKNKINLSSREAKLLYWKQVSKGKFALAPPGLGTDTHRVWEILNLHCVPIVISSPLDGLYRMFPIIIVDKWPEIFVEGALSKFENEITGHFGANPFNSQVQEMLRSSFWIDMIKNGSKSRIS